MRLGQLSRQTGLKPDEIVSFLSEQGISIKSGSNAKIDDEHVGLVYEGFDLEQPQTVEEVVEAPPQATEDKASQAETIDSPTPEIPKLDPKSEVEALYDHSMEEEEFTPEELEEIQSKLAAQKLAAEEANKPENPNLIKAPKVSLQGLTVVGKIDLPEPKVKEEEEIKEEPTPEPPKATEVVRNKKRNPNQHRNAQRNRNKDINPIELKRRKEKNAARARKRKKLEEEKERKRQFYLKQVQEKAIEQKKEESEASVEEPVKPAAKPRVVKRRNFLARFWRALDAKDPSES